MLPQKPESVLAQISTHVFKTKATDSTPGWPVMAAVILLLCASVALISTAWLNNRSHRLTTQLVVLEKEQTALDGRLTSPAAPLPMVPNGRKYLTDLGRIFELAKQDEVRIGVVDYKLLAIEGTPLTLRSVAFQVYEDYPKIKGFISHVLESLPNIALQEIRIERKDSTVSRGAIMLKFSLVYKNSGEMHPGALRQK